MSKRIIGISPLWDEEKQSVWMLPGYMEGIIQAGGVPVILPLTNEIELLRSALNRCDGLLLTGGQDVSPLLYGETQIQETRCFPLKDQEEISLLDMALAEKLPVLGICRGLQLLNVYKGGTLYQDLPTQHPSNTRHQQNPPYDRPCHSNHIVRPGPLYELFQKETIAVNSYHHQAIRTLGQGLEPMAVSEDGIVEAVYMPAMHFAWAVQWHPEFALNAAESIKLFAALIAACEGGGYTHETSLCQ